VKSTTRPAFSVSGLALVGPVLAIVAACAVGGGGSGSGRAQSNSISKRIEEVRITEDRMVADAKAASAGREDGYWRDAKYFKDIRDKVCKFAQPESKGANPARIISMTKSIKSANDRLRALTTDAVSRVERRSNVHDALIVSECKSVDLGTEAYFQCSSMEHARSWQRVMALELSDLNTINDAAAGWAVDALECLKAALTKRLEKEDLDLSESIYQAWTGYKDRRISSAQDLDSASLQFAQSK
jgi:hypothetical protein